jgi:hypothetical protein
MAHTQSGNAKGRADTMPQGKKLRKALAGKGLVTAPGVYDMISPRLPTAWASARSI